MTLFTDDELLAVLKALKPGSSVMRRTLPTACSVTSRPQLGDILVGAFIAG
jgi:hypothetical protein